MEPHHYWVQSLGSPLREAAEDMQAEVSELAVFIDLDLDRPKAADEIVARFLQLRMRHLERDLQQIRFRIQAAQERSPETAGDTEEVWNLTRQVQLLAPQKSRLEQALIRRRRPFEDDLVGQVR